MISVCMFAVLYLVPTAAGVLQENDDEKVRKKWVESVEQLSKLKVFKAMLIDKKGVLGLQEGFAKSFWEVAKGFDAGQHVICRCPPKGRLYVTVILEGGDLLSVQVEVKHWFRAVVVSKGHAENFILKDEKDRLSELILKYWKGLCDGCGAGTDDVGTCSMCHGPTQCGNYKLCAKCSIERRECMHCGKPL